MDQSQALETRPEIDSPTSGTGAATSGGRIRWGSAALTIEIALPADAAPYLVAVGRYDLQLQMPPGLPLVDVLTVAHGHTPASDRLVHTDLGAGLRYHRHETRQPQTGQLQLTVELVGADGLLVELQLQVFDAIGVLRATSVVRNAGTSGDIVLRAVPSFATYLGSPTSPGDGINQWRLQEADSDWLGENRWTDHPLRGPRLPNLLDRTERHNARGEHKRVSTGTWSTGRALPMGLLVHDSGAAWGWQIEHNGAWRWEVGEDTADGYFALSGPTDEDHQWTVVLHPGDHFQTVPVAIALAPSPEQAVAELTRYRRRTRRPHPDNLQMPVVFNDYMNTLMGAPTTEQLLPLIEAASRVGAEVFCVDAGWYADGYWWDSVGEWIASTERFPAGLEQVVDAIRAAGMTPGLWLEPEVIGIRSPLADRLPTAAFLQRHGQRIVEHDRYILDLRHPAAIEHLDTVVDGLIQRYGVGYFKFDYNVDPATGTDRDSDSVGAGLLEHNRAHLAWLDALLDRHPSLILENCGSGAMRADYAMLSRLQLQSTSDQEDYRRYPPIAAAAPMSILPEQAASWAYPQAHMTAEEVSFCLVTGLAGRLYLSGYLNRMSSEQCAMVAAAVRVAKATREHLRDSVPLWPLGLPSWDDAAVALGLQRDQSILMTVWDRAGRGDPIELHLPQLQGRDVEAETVFPTTLPAWQHDWNPDTATLTLLPAQTGLGARQLRISTSIAS